MFRIDSTVMDEKYHLLNGFVDLNRDIIVSILEIINDRKKTENIIGMAETFYIWSKHRNFRRVQLLLYSSRVIWLRNLSEAIDQNDVLILCRRCGQVINIVWLSDKNQALVEFRDLNASTDFIRFHSNAHFYKLQSLRPAAFVQDILHSGHPAYPAHPPSPVLLYTIFNALYPMTVSVFRHVYRCTWGCVRKVAIFTTLSGDVQALIKFSSVETAAAVRNIFQSNEHTDFHVKANGFFSYECVCGVDGSPVSAVGAPAPAAAAAADAVEGFTDTSAGVYPFFDAGDRKSVV